jgi:hypothetical protein
VRKSDLLIDTKDFISFESDYPNEQEMVQLLSDIAPPSKMWQQRRLASFFSAFDFDQNFAKLDISQYAKAFKCTFCTQQYTTAGSMSRHIKRDHA